VVDLPAPASHHGVPLPKPPVAGGDLGLIADALVFGNLQLPGTELPIDVNAAPEGDQATAAGHQPGTEHHPAAGHQADTGHHIATYPEIESGQAPEAGRFTEAGRFAEPGQPVEAGIHLGEALHIDETLRISETLHIGDGPHAGEISGEIDDVELLLNAAHLDAAHQTGGTHAVVTEHVAVAHTPSAHGSGPQAGEVEHHSDAVFATPDDAAQLAQAAHLAQTEGAILLGSEADAATESETSNETGAEPTAAAPGAPKVIKPSQVFARPRPMAPPAPEPVTVQSSDLTEADDAEGVVTATLNRMLRPTPRDVSSIIGRPTERPFRPTYSTGPDQPKQGTWAAQWSQVIDSVVGRVLNSLTKTTTPDNWNVIGLGRPSIPQDIDKALLLDATEAMGVYTLSDAERHEVRAAFWREFDHITR